MEQNNYNSKALIKNMPTAFAHHKVIFDENENPVDYIFIDANKKFEELTGLKRENIINKRATEVLDKITDDSFDWIQFYGKISLNGGKETLEEYSKRLSSWYKVEVYSQKKGYFTTIFSDITERKEKEQELKKKSKRLNDIFNNINDVIWSMSWPDLKVQFISKVVENIVGYTKEKFKEDPKFIQKITHPEDKKINERALEQLKENGNIKREFRVICKDDSIKWFQDRGKMVYNEKGEPIRVEGVMRDITKRKKVEEKMKANKDKYETIFNSSPVGIILEDEKGNIIEANDMMTKMSGYTKKELEGSNVFDKFVLSENKNVSQKNIKKIIEENKEIKFETKTRIKNGEIKRYQLNETSIRLPNGNKGLVSMQLDVTEQKRYEKIMKELNKVAVEFQSLDDKKEICQKTIEIAKKVLDFDLCSIRLVKNNEFIPIATYDSKKADTLPIDYGIMGKAYKNNENYLTLNIKENPDANPLKDSYKSAITVSMKNLGVFQAVSTKKNAFSQKDLELAEILISNTKATLERGYYQRKLKYKSFHDNLTGLYNRRFFEEEMNRLDTKRQLPISIIMADVNGLKIINDTYGHSTGDDLLVKTAEILKSAIRKEDLIARWAGDEFVILLPQTSKEKAEKIIKRLKNKQKNITKENIPISIGMGVATKEKINQDIDSVLENADDRMYQNKLSESRSANNKIVQNLINTLGAKSSETKEHAIRMTNLAHQLGEKLKLSNTKMNKLSLLATLHDIGKTTISENILTKPEKLTDKEWDIIKEHPERGYKIASASEEFGLVAEEILSHHERWDGNGYPRGLSGEDIPYLARIISIIDAYDVMTHERPYSKSISNKKALDEIKDCAGSQFDPDLAQEFIELKIYNE